MSENDGVCDSVCAETKPPNRPGLTKRNLAHHLKLLERKEHQAAYGGSENGSRNSPSRQHHSAMSDEDDDISISTDPVEAWRVIEEYYRKLGAELRPDGVYLMGRLLRPPIPKLRKRRTRRMLVGLETPLPDTGLKRSPTGRVRSLRLEALRKKKAAARPRTKREKARKRKAPGSKVSKRGRDKSKAGSKRRKASAIK